MRLGYGDPSLFTHASQGDLVAVGFKRQSSWAELWNIRDGTRAATLGRQTEASSSLSFNGQGDQVLSASLVHESYLWNATTGKEIKFFPEYKRGWGLAVISASGRAVFTSSADSVGIIWDADKDPLSTGVTSRLTGHKDIITGCEFLANDKHLLTSSMDGTVRTWDARTGNQLQAFALRSPSSGALSIAPKGDLIAIGCQDGSIAVFDLKTGRHLHNLASHKGAVYKVALDRRGNLLASCSLEDSYGGLWHARTGKYIAKLDGKADAVAISDGGEFVATSSSETRIWQIEYPT